MKQTATNEFKDGLNLDLHPIVTPNTVLTDSLNGTFITYNGNEFCLQNDRGNQKIISSVNEQNVEYVHLPEGYTPIGIKEHNGVLYIVSVNDNKTEIGTFPAPRYPITWNDTLYSEEYKGSFKDENGYVMYDALHVLDGHSPLTNIDLGYTIETPVTIEVQDSYDGSVNLILIADGCKPRIINSGFSVLPDDKYKFVNRKQDAATNIYSQLERESELIRTSNVLTNIDLLGVQSGGQWKGGNYTFYIKFGDGDFNQTDVVAESGIVSIFNGNDGVPSTISGTLLDERTDKMIQLKITGLNTAYSKLYIYFTREYSDVNGYRMTEAGMLVEPIDINPVNPGANVEDKDLYQNIWLTGFEQQVPIDIEELNVDYHTVDWARAEAQHSNMLFLGNVGQKETFKLYQDLDSFTKSHIVITAKQTSTSLNTVSLDYNSGNEYYYTHNIYYNLGYWPDEIYRFGIVYVLSDGSTTPVFNITGGFFEKNETDPNNVFYQIIENDNQLYPTNEYGVVLTPDVKILGKNNSDTTVCPLYFNFEMDTELPDNTIGWFVVRQKRIPRTICQGLSIGVDEKSHLPLLKDENGKWNIESFLSYARNIVPDESVLNEIEELEDQTEWWKYLLDGLAWLTFLPMVNTAATIDIARRWKAENKLDGIYAEVTDAPKLEYLQKSKNTYVPDQVYIAIRTQDYYEEQVYRDFIADFAANFEEGENAIVDMTLYNQNVFEENDMVYDCEYQVYSGSKNEDEQGNISWTITPVTKVYYLSNNNTVYPTLLNFVYDGTSMSAETAGDITQEEIVPFLTALYNQEEVSNLLKRLIIENDDALGANGLLSLDPCVNSTVASILDGSKFKLIPQYNTKVVDNDSEIINHNSKYYNYEIDSVNSGNTKINRCTYISPNTNIKAVVDGNTSFEFSNVAGNAYDVSQYKKVHDSFYVVKSANDDGDERYDVVDKDSEYVEDLWEINNINIVRGLYCPYIGISSKTLSSPTIYSVRLLEQNASILELMKVRQQDSSEYYCISKKTDGSNINVFRGDCYTNTVSIRINRNFIDPTAPVVEQIVDDKTWAKNVLLKKEDFEDLVKEKPVKEAVWDQVNAADVNTVDLGMWATFKCLSSYNLGLRSKDSFHVDEMSILGSPRTFYPLNGASTATGNKMEESFLLNDGLSATVSRKRYNAFPEKSPYSKSEFANRIMFSNINITDTYTNGYRTFQGLSYKDYDKQYGAITKLLPLGQNLFVVMEHGVGLVPVNPKALMQTTTGEMIHIYGYGVLPDEMTIVSQDYGSKYEHSVIRTPIGIYGIDVDARKVWRFSDKQGFQTISDMKVETYLKDWLENQKRAVKMGVSDIRTHYNAKKGDLIFTWYDSEQLCSICFNERQNLWTTRYDWCPIVSENINDEFYSLNKKYNEPRGNCYIWDHKFDVAKLRTNVSSWYDNNNTFEFEFVVSDPVGIHKIFDNLQIISNNVQPKELEITIIGDDYMFKRDELSFTDQDYEYVREEYPSHQSSTTSNIHDCEDNKEYLNLGPEVEYKWDWRLHQNAICKTQQLKDIYEFGRRMGNIQYKNGMWFAQIEPLRMNVELHKAKIKEIRIRDKWAKIRIRYSGKDLAVITAIKTLINI